MGVMLECFPAAAVAASDDCAHLERGSAVVEIQLAYHMTFHVTDLARQLDPSNLTSYGTDPLEVVVVAVTAHLEDV